MLLKKLILLSLILLFLSCHRKPDITIYDTYYEILKGKVKTLTEQHKNQNGVESDITTFDERGNAIQLQEVGGYCGNCTIKFSYKYDKKGIKTEVVMHAKDRQQRYRCDTNGRIAEERYDGKEYDFDKEDFGKKKDVFKYNAKGYLTELASYDNAERTYFTTYKYNKQNLLSVIDEFAGTRKKPFITVIYAYISIDGKGNWLKRTSSLTRNLIINSQNTQTVNKDTVTRKITYY